MNFPKLNPPMCSARVRNGPLPAAQKLAATGATTKVGRASLRPDTCFELTSELFYSSGKFRGLEAQVQQWTRKESWGCRRSLREPGAQHLLSWQRPCRCPPWDFHTPPEPTFCTTSFSSACVLPQVSSWDVCPVPWCLSREHAHLICKPLLPDLHVYCQRMGQPLVCSPEGFVPLKCAVGRATHPSSKRRATTLPSLPSRGLRVCSRGFLPFPSNQQVGMHAWKSWGCLQGAWALGMGNQTLGREEARETLAPEWANQTEGSVGGAWEMEASGRQRPVNFGKEDNAETKVLQWESPRLVISKHDGEILTLGWGSPDPMGDEHRAKIRELEKRNQRRARGENPATKAYTLDNQDQLRHRMDAKVQIAEWGNQGKSRNEGVTETQVFEKNEKEASGEGKGEIQARGLGKQGQAGGEDGEESQVLWRGKQDQTRGDTGTEIQEEERGNECQVGGENVVQTQVPGRETLGEIKQGGGVEIQALGQGKQVSADIENGAEIQALGREGQEGRDQGRGGKAAGEVQKQLRHAFLVGWGCQGTRGGKGAGETQTPRRRNPREIREEDWVVIQTLWCLGDQRPVASETVREFENWENRDQIGGKHGAEIQTPEKRDQRRDREEDGLNALAPEVENQAQVKGEMHVDTHPPGGRNQEQVAIPVPEMESLRGVKGEDGEQAQKWEEKRKNQEHVGSMDSANTQVSDAANWGELTSKMDGETCSGWKKEEQAGGVQASGRRSRREAGGEGGGETQRPETESLGQLDSGNGESCSPGRRTWEQRGGKSDAENQTLEKRNQREAGSEQGRKIQSLRGGNRKLLKSKAGAKTCTSEWKNQEQIRGENGPENQTQGKRNPREGTSEDGRETQAPGGEDQEQLRSQIDGEILTQGQENQEKGGEEDTVEVWEVGSRRKGGAEDTGEPGIPRGGIEGQVRDRAAAAEGNLQVDCFGVEGPPSAHGLWGRGVEHKQAVSCPEMKPLPHQGELFLLSSGEGKHLASKGRAPAKRHRMGVSPASQQAPPQLQRSRQRDKRVNPGKASGLAGHLQKTQSPAASLNLPSSCPSDSCGPAPQAVTAAVRVPSALPVLPKWPVLKKSQQLLLESLMRRKMAHLKWGLPRRILDSHLLLSLVDLRPLPFAGVWLPGSPTACELQQQQERPRETQGSELGLRSPEKFWRVRPSKGKSSKLSTQSRALEKFGPHGLEPTGILIHPPKPRRVRRPGGPREIQDVQKEAPPRAEHPAPRAPRPAAESGNWCGQERVREPSSDNSGDRKMVRPGISQMAERVPGRVRALSSRAGHVCGPKEGSSQEVSEPPRLLRQQSTPWRRESLEGRGAEQPSFSCSADASSLKGGLRSAAASLSMTLLNKTACSPRLARPQRSAPDLSLQGSDPTLLPEVGGPHVGDSLRDRTSSKRDLQPPGHCSAGAVLPETESVQDQGEPENPNGAPQNPLASKRRSFMKQLRSFLLRLCFTK